jgi:leader peptidase (prepilin peptidase) / N-methyltransferase
MPILIVGAALIGLAIGSFLNVVIHRVPLERSLSTPGSHCPACENPIRARHNVPVIGWLALGGKCADCATAISVRYPLVELATGLLFVAVTWQADRLDELPALPALLFFTAAGIALSLIDLDVKRLPNAIVLPSYPVIALLLTIAAVLADDPAALVRALIGGLALFGGYFALAFAYPAGMGFGDVKLAGIVGGVLGYLSYAALLVGAFAAFLLGGVVGVVVLLSRHGARKTALPFGPFMFAGTLIALFAGPQIAGVYTDLVF